MTVALVGPHGAFLVLVRITPRPRPAIAQESSWLTYLNPFPSEDTDCSELANTQGTTLVPTSRARPGQQRLDVWPFCFEDLEGVVVAIKQNQHHNVKRLLQVDRSKPAPSHATVREIPPLDLDLEVNAIFSLDGVEARCSGLLQL
uniref:Uncharacterized protein n=1 Tax=Pseudomonas fluorescens (strain SBW25) TaxID=216595 RepID=A4V6Z6_PSEFS|nr:hypothetical protein pQBR0275 [Pseudomonas fluorescens SBW25]